MPPKPSQSQLLRSVLYRIWQIRYMDNEPGIPADFELYYMTTMGAIIGQHKHLLNTLTERIDNVPKPQNRSANSAR